MKSSILIPSKLTSLLLALAIGALLAYTNLVGMNPQRAKAAISDATTFQYNGQECAFFASAGSAYSNNERAAENGVIRFTDTSTRYAYNSEDIDRLLNQSNETIRLRNGYIFAGSTLDEVASNQDPYGCNDAGILLGINPSETLSNRLGWWQGQLVRSVGYNVCTHTLTLNGQNFVIANAEELADHPFGNYLDCANSDGSGNVGMCPIGSTIPDCENARFSQFNGIHYRGENYKLAFWSGNSFTYVLNTSANAQRTAININGSVGLHGDLPVMNGNSICRPFIIIGEDLDLNIDGDPTGNDNDRVREVDDFFNKMNSLEDDHGDEYSDALVYDFNFDCQSIDEDGEVTATEPSSDILRLISNENSSYQTDVRQLSHLRRMLRYYPADNTITFLEMNPGQSESLLLAQFTYTRSTDNPQLFLANRKYFDECTSTSTENPMQGASYIELDVNPSTISAGQWTAAQIHVPQSRDCFESRHYDGNLAVQVMSATASAPNTSDNPDDPAGGQVEESCESAGAIAWLLCPIILGADGALNWLDTRIQGLLAVDEEKYLHEGLRDAWAQVRNIAYLVLIPIMLVMVIGTALGFEIFSAYTVKKALPRMVIAVIFITLSWYITTFLVGFFNVVGGGILGVLTRPFDFNGNAVSTLSLADLFPYGGGSGGIYQAIVGNTAISLGIVVVLFLFLAPLSVIVLTAFLVLFLRQMFIIALSLLAPLAILSWIFPGNDKLWKMWWSAFSKLLMMFPLIMVIIAVGRIFAAIIAGPGETTAVDTIMSPLFILAAYILPYAAIPFTFKLAGGIFANLTGMMQNGEKGIFGRMKESRGAKLQRAKSGNLFKGGDESNFRGKFNRGYERAANIKNAGFNPLKARQRQNAALGNAAYDEAMEAREKNTDLRAILGNDDYLEAGMLSTDEGEIKRELASRGYDEAGQKQGAALIRAAQRSMSDQAFRVAASVSNAATGTGYGGGAGEMYAAINRAAGGNRALANRMLADARGLAERARRPDLVASGFGAASQIMQQVYNGGNTDAAAAAATLQQDTNTLHTQDPRTIISAKPAMLRRLAPLMQQEIHTALASGNPEQADTVLAKYAAMYDQMAATSPESAQVMADQVLSQTVTTQGTVDAGGILQPGPGLTTVRDAIEQARSRKPNERGQQRFLELRREYGNRYAADQANGVNNPPIQPES